MSVSALLQIIPVLFVLAIMAVAFVRHQNARQQQTQGVLWLQAMRMLITHIQRHRGLSSAVLGGDRSLASQLEDTQLQVSRDFVQIGSVGEWIKHHEGWQLITQHWARLAGNIFNLTVQRNIDQHNKLIKNILVLVDEIALRHYLTGQGSVRSGIWRELLGLAELMGQARALGSVITACGEVWETTLPKGTRKQMQVICQEILNLLETPKCRSELHSDLFERVLEFLSLIETSLLSEGPILDASEFYKRSTAAIDCVLEQFDEELVAVSKRLVKLR